jgi:hypothetical protein
MRWVNVCSVLFWFQEAVLWWAWAASWMCLTGWTLPNWHFITRRTPPPSGSETTVARGPLSPANSCVTKRQVSDTHTQRERATYMSLLQFPDSSFRTEHCLTIRWYITGLDWGLPTDGISMANTFICSWPSVLISGSGSHSTPASPC